MQSNDILTGIKVVDLTQALAGPTCTMYLGDMGADVIKVERPGSGDMSRDYGPPFIDGESAYFLSINRNKRSLTLNYRKPEGLRILHRLIDEADVFVNNLPRQASLEKYGLSAETCLARNPRLIHLSITGFGRTGPYADRSGYDVVAQAMSGTMDLTGEADQPPLRFPVAIADITAGLFGLISVLGALYARERTGKGQAIDTSLLETQLTWLSYVAGSYFATGEQPAKLGNLHPSITPYQPFKTADGRWIIVGVGSDRLWQAYCKVIGAEDTLMNDPRYATNSARNENRPTLLPLLEEIMGKKPADHWLAELQEAGIPGGPINTVEEILADPQIAARRMIVELNHPVVDLAKSLAFPARFSDTPITYRLPPPLLGEHTDQVLTALDYSPGEIERLHQAGVV
ncbi:MAG: CaiB/BaiF CoA-transferase family protein [Chloroflexota bacterium]|nr:CaiB/BaiF CoA-transferase family protein [Chloroflexota bacterium]